MYDTIKSYRSEEFNDTDSKVFSLFIACCSSRASVFKLKKKDICYSIEYTLGNVPILRDPFLGGLGSLKYPAWSLGFFQKAS